MWDESEEMGARDGTEMSPILTIVNIGDKLTDGRFQWYEGGAAEIHV